MTHAETCADKRKFWRQIEHIICDRDSSKFENLPLFLHFSSSYLLSGMIRTLIIFHCLFFSHLIYFSPIWYLLYLITPLSEDILITLACEANQVTSKGDRKTHYRTHISLLKNFANDTRWELTIKSRFGYILIPSISWTASLRIKPKKDAFPLSGANV